MEADLHTESAFARTRREFAPAFLGLRGVLWSVLWAAVAIGATIYLSPNHSMGAQVAIGVGLFLAGIGWAALTLFGALWVTAPARQRDEARHALALARAEREEGFPDVHLKTGSPLLIETTESKMFPGHRETLIVVTVTATNREIQRRAILAFSAHVTFPKPRLSVQKLSRTYEDDPHPHFIPDPLKLDAQDHRKGEVAFLWSHDMDFLLGRDKSEEEVLDFVMENLRLNATDHISSVSIDLDLPGTYQANDNE